MPTTDTSKAAKSWSLIPRLRLRPQISLPRCATSLRSFRSGCLSGHCFARRAGLHAGRSASLFPNLEHLLELVRHSASWPAGATAPSYAPMAILPLIWQNSSSVFEADQLQDVQRHFPVPDYWVTRSCLQVFGHFLKPKRASLLQPGTRPSPGTILPRTSTVTHPSQNLPQEPQTSIQDVTVASPSSSSPSSSLSFPAASISAGPSTSHHDVSEQLHAASPSRQKVAGYQTRTEASPPRDEALRLTSDSSAPVAEDG